MNSVVEIFRSYIGKEMLDERVPIVVRWLNLRIREANAGHIVLEVLVRADMCNPAQVLHGGLQCTIMDEAFGMAVGSLGVDNFHVNTNLHIDFLHPAPLGSTVIAEAKVIRAGKQMKNVQCELRLENGTILSRGTSNLFRTNQAPLKAHTD